MRVAGSSLFVLVAAALALPAQEPTKNDLLFAVEKQLQGAHATAGPCVGCVVVSRSEKYPKPAGSADDVPGALGSFDPVQYLKDTPRAKPLVAVALDLSKPENIPDHGFACGVVIDEKELILTPYHVIEGATKIYVHLPGRVGSYADIHAADARTDLAVLRLLTPPTGLKAIKFADVRLDERGPRRATVSVGKLAVLMANPYASNFRIDKPSAALGSVTNVRHHLTLTGLDKLRRLDSYYYHGAFLEHDAKLNSGISGAALLNLDGEMIGLTTTAPGLGLGDKTPEYAFPLTEPLVRVIDVLRRGEEVEGGALGIALGKEFNAVGISSVLPLGPAAKAGIRANDTITHVNGAPVSSYDELLGRIGSELAGTKITVTVRRNGNQTGDVILTLGKWQHDRPVIASARPAPVFGLRVDHDSILAQRVADNVQAILQKEIPVGVCVREIIPDSPAAAAFKKLGDRPERWLITHVNGETVANPAEFYRAAKGQKAIKLTVIDPTEAKRPEREVSFP